MATTMDPKALRGTKRVCQTCEVRFYDLLREHIVCPSCGAVFTVATPSEANANRRDAPGSAKTGWRQSYKRPSPAPEPDLEQPVAAEDAELADDEGPVADAAPEDDTVLESETDDGDLSGLVDVDVEEPKER